MNFSSDFFGFEINGDLVSDEKKLAEPINENYICIVEKPSGKKNFSIGNKDDSSTDASKVKEIISAYSTHTRILRVHNEVNLEKSIKQQSRNEQRRNQNDHTFRKY